VGPTQSTAVSHKSCLSHAGAGTGTACLTNACLASSHAAPCSSSPPIYSTTPAAALALSHSAFSFRATPPRSLPLAPISPSAAAPATSSRLRRLSPTVSLRCRLRSYIFFSPRSTVLPPLLPFSRATARRRSMPPPFLPLLFSPAPSLTPPPPRSILFLARLDLPALRRHSSFLCSFSYRTVPPSTLLVAGRDPARCRPTGSSFPFPGVLSAEINRFISICRADLSHNPLLLRFHSFSTSLIREYLVQSIWYSRSGTVCILILAP
jgi:hypothetical protein